MQGTLALGERGNEKTSPNLCFHELLGSNICSRGRTSEVGTDLSLL